MEVYKIVVNEEVYVGSSITIDSRWREHINQLRGNRHHNIALQRHYNKYGEDSLAFSIIEACRDEETLREREEYWIEKIGTINLTKTATGGDRTAHLRGNPEYHARLRETRERGSNPAKNSWKNLTEKEREDRKKVWSDVKKGKGNGRYKHNKPFIATKGEEKLEFKDLCEAEEHGFNRRYVHACLEKKKGFLSHKGYKFSYLYICAQ